MAMEFLWAMRLADLSYNNINIDTLELIQNYIVRITTIGNCN